MAKYLTDRQDRKLEDTVRKVDGLAGRNTRLLSPAFKFPGTDLGSLIVPRTTIPAVTRTVQAGSDKFEPGVGTAYLFRVATGGEIEPRVDNAGVVVFKTIYNFSTKSYAANNPAPTTDYIGPTTSVVFAFMDLSGKLFIPGGDDLFDVSADDGTTVTIDPKDTLDFDATDQDWDTEANGTQVNRGIVVKISTDGADSTIKRLQTAIDKSPLQNVVLSGSRTSGTTPVLVKSGTRNSIEFAASATSIIDLVGGAGKITYSVHNPLATIRDDAAATEALNYEDILEITSDIGKFTVTKVGSVVTVNLSGAGDHLGVFKPNYLEPILDNGKYYMDSGSGADTDWALADGASNASPGSGIQLATQSGTASSYFVRARAGTTGNAADTAFGRPVVAGDVDNDEVKIEISVDAHPDHLHQFTPDTCHGDVAATTHFDFSTSATRNTSIQKASPGGGALTLDHTVVLTLTNNQGASDEHIEMTPPYKELYWFERVA